MRLLGIILNYIKSTICAKYSIMYGDTDRESYRRLHTQDKYIIIYLGVLHIICVAIIMIYFVYNIGLIKYIHN
jgi:hypothetical protein